MGDEILIVRLDQTLTLFKNRNSVVSIRRLEG